jgi:squalene cyclase
MNVGAWITAQVVTVLRYLDVLDATDTELAARWLSSQQRADGSFAIHAFSTAGDLGSTAVGWAALHLCGAAQAAQRARAFVEQHGGVPAVLDRINEGDLSALFLGMAGLVEPSRLPCPNTAMLLVPPIRQALETRFHSGVFMMAFEFEFLVRRLRGSLDRNFLDELKFRGAIDVLSTFQNDNGSWNDSAVISVLALPCLDAIGNDEARAMLARGLTWVNAQKVRDERGLRFDGFGAEVWTTAFNVRALLAGGEAPNSPRMRKALLWLADAQLVRPMPRVDNRKRNAVLTGGWAMQRTNHTMPDCDDAGVVLTVFGMAMAAKEGHRLDEAASTRLQRSAHLGTQWLFDMQNPDGGWSAFVWNLPGKPPGPIMQKNPKVDMTNPLDFLVAAVDVPPPMSDPSTEDLTSRVLHGLGQLGFRDIHPAVMRGVEFLRQQQASNGGWWGRWVVNYLSATSYVLMGLAAVKADLKAPWVRRGIEFLLAHQNPDGGWGEGPESYRSIANAARGPTMLPLTALVLQALIEVGEGDGEAVTKGVDLLLKSQNADGTWANGEYLHVNVPPDTFYVYPEAARFYPTELLAKYLAWKKQTPTQSSRWSNARLDAMRLAADPTADAVIESIFRQSQVDGVNALMWNIFRTDEPLPASLPAEARAFFLDEALPAFADPRLLEQGATVFTQAGWQVATALFCSALPQAYAAAKGAHVLTRTMAMTRRTEQRILETAQFLFDVVAPGGFGPSGRAVRATQKVRLMHAAVRYLLLHPQAPGQAAWDSAGLGLPLNQEDLAGTLMTFSVVVLEGLERLGVHLAPEAQEAWLHLWKVVGHFMGVDASMLPATLDDAHDLMEAIRERQWKRSEDGIALTQPLVALMQRYFRVEVLDGFPVALIRHLAGDHCADLLGLPAADWTQQVVAILAELESLWTRQSPDEVSRRLIDHGLFGFMRLVVNHMRRDKQARFRIPPSLLQTVDPKA